MSEEHFDPYQDRIIFSADQEPFQTQAEREWFCCLYPLMTIDGNVLDGDEQIFPNRGRVWWMLRSDIASEDVQPGSLWLGSVEPSPQFSPADRDKDQFQADVNGIRRLTDDVYEVVDVQRGVPDVGKLRRGQPFPCDRPTASRVFLRGGTSVLGPLFARWDGSGVVYFEQVRKSGEARADVLQLSRSDFDRMVNVYAFEHEAHQYDISKSPVKFDLNLILPDDISFQDLRKVGKVLDVSPDKSVLSWAAETASLSRKERQQFMKTAEAVADSSDAPDEYMDRFREMREKADRILQMGAEAADILATTEPFAELVEAHIEEITEKEVAARVEQRRHELETKLGDLDRKKKRLQKEIDELQETFRTERNQQRKALEKENQEFLEQLEQRKKQLGQKEKALDERQQQLEERLKELIERYQNEADGLVTDTLAQLPLLQHFLPENPRTRERSISGDGPVKLRLPSFLDRDREPSDSLEDEDAFLQQFAEVVKQRGFLFSQDDLINFHVSVKSGFLTVLAGQSGTGKSSLPRLYAEALGCEDEYLMVPVRPDWMDDRDLLGAFNPLARRFEPQNSGFSERLIAAHIDMQRDRGGIYIICLDEMNLARVEHYFARFLSILEADSDARFIDLFAKGVISPEDPYSKYRRIPINTNVRFVGTVNIDETAHFFSPKVLDRTEVVTFERPNLEAAAQTQVGDPIGGLQPVHYSKWSDWNKEDRSVADSRQFLLRIDDILKKSHQGLSYRQFQRILRYVACAQPFFTEDKALDFQLAQVVLPALRRTAIRFDETLEELREMITSVRFPRTHTMLERLREAGPEDEFFQLL